MPLEVVIVNGKHAATPKIAEAPVKTVGKEGRQAIKSFVEQQHQIISKSIEPGLVDNLMKQLEKNQNAPGQQTMTKQAIDNLGLPKTATDEVQKQVEKKTVTRPVAPRTGFNPRPRSYDPTRANDGRGYLRVPLGITVQ